MDTRTSPHRLRIEKTQEALQRHGLAALLVPSSDPHLSEYMPERWQGRQWLSGFTGSMGTLVVARDRAALFADSRYWVQAEAELAGSGIELVKIPTGTSPLHVDWLARLVKPGDTVAVDGAVIGLAAALSLRAALEKAGMHVCAPMSTCSPRCGPIVPPCRPTRFTNTSHRTRHWPASPSSPRCARPWRHGPRTTWCPPSTTSPGCSTCAAPTSPTTPCSWPMR